VISGKKKELIQVENLEQALSDRDMSTVNRIECAAVE
jgi:hypothetical protein